jgi:Outer membrane lipoprotein
MSGDPERLLSATNADPLERELLGSVRYVGPPEGAKDQAWRSIAGQIAVVAAVGAVSSSTAAAASKVGFGTMASWALSTKIAAVAVVGGFALGGGYLAVQSTKPSVSLSSAPRTVVPPVTHAAPALPPKAAEVVAQTPEEAPAEVAPSHKVEPLRLDALKAESALLTDARAQLRSGNPAGAQASLDRLQAQFPKGMLTQEREVLSIEVLYARGNVEGAKRRAKAFVKAYPKSPHSAKLSRFLE